MSKWVIVSDDILLIENIFHMSGESFKGRILFPSGAGRFGNSCFHGSGSSAMDKIIVGIAKERLPGKIRCLSYALGSCVGICLYDRRERT